MKRFNHDDSKQNNRMLNVRKMNFTQRKKANMKKKRTDRKTFNFKTKHVTVKNGEPHATNWKAQSESKV